MAKRMRGNVLALGEEDREWLHEALSHGYEHRSYREIERELRERGYTISKSGIGRYYCRAKARGLLWELIWKPQDR